MRSKSFCLIFSCRLWEPIMFNCEDNLYFQMSHSYYRVPTLSLNKCPLLEHFLLKLLKPYLYLQKIRTFLCQMVQRCHIKEFCFNFSNSSGKPLSILSKRRGEERGGFHLGKASWLQWRSSRAGGSTEAQGEARVHWIAVQSPDSSTTTGDGREKESKLLRRKPGNDLNMGEDNFLTWITK